MITKHTTIITIIRRRNAATMTVHHMVLKNPAKEKNRHCITIFLDCAGLEEVISIEITVVIVVAEGHMRNVKAWKQYNCGTSNKVFLELKSVQR